MGLRHKHGYIRPLSPSLPNLSLALSPPLSLPLFLILALFVNVLQHTPLHFLKASVRWKAITRLSLFAANNVEK